MTKKTGIVRQQAAKPGCKVKSAAVPEDNRASQRCYYYPANKRFFLMFASSNLQPTIMKPLFYLLAFFLISCNTQENNFQTTPSGIRYKIYHHQPAGKKAPMMATAKVNVTEFKNDTPVNSLKMPLYQMVLPPAPFMTDALAEIMVTTGVKEGDSLVTITKENRRVDYTIRKVFILGENGNNTDSIINLDKKTETQYFIDAHAKLAAPRIEKYLLSKNISAVKNPDNTFTEIMTTGAKPLADTGKSVGITFAITNLATGKIINSNKDTTFHQPPVLEYIIGKGFMPMAVDNAIKQLGKGGHARIYLPGIMAAGPKINDPNANFYNDIVFDVELVSIK